ncbi:YwqG family protein, partial [Rhodobacteraceae bacterium]|nr:YwqG family protein [Paracoccaceae bacterium]
VLSLKRCWMSQENAWRQKIEKPCSALIVGGFRPTNELTSSCFGEVRASAGEEWPSFNGQFLWPVCQLNLLDAPYVPECLKDIAVFQFFVFEEYWNFDVSTIDTVVKSPTGPFFIRTYNELDGISRAHIASHSSTFRPFEAKWKNSTLVDYPTHDTMPIDFDALGIGDYYDQEGVDQVQATKLGGWPSCIQSEPWWDYRAEGKEFEFALQIDSEDKAKCHWGDGGAVYLARHKTMKHLWAVDWQCF